MNQAHQKQQKRHQNCEMELRLMGPHTGLYCRPHNKWMKWVSAKEAKIIANLGVKYKNV